MGTEFRNVLDGFNRAGCGEIMQSVEPWKTIRRALLIADRLMENPTNSMVQATSDGWSYNSVFIAMRDQMLREIDNADGGK